MSLIDIDSVLIPATHLDNGHGVLELSALWQSNNKASNQAQHGDTLALLFHPNPKHGGTMSHKVVSTMYRYARDRGFSVVRYNSRGVGRSSGIATASDLEFDDAVCAFNHIIAQPNFDGIKTLWLGGFSFGGFMACRLAEYLQLNYTNKLDYRLTLIAPSIVRHDVTLLTVDWQKAVMVYSDDDELVAPSVMRDFAQKYGISSQVFNKAGHFFHGQQGKLYQAIADLNQHHIPIITTTNPPSTDTL